MNAIELQEELDATRVRLLEVLASVPEEALVQPGAVGQWSVADVLAHFVNWEAELVTAFNHIDQGKTPQKLLEALDDREAYNAQRYNESKGRDLGRIFDDLQSVRGQLAGWLEEFSTADLQKPGRFSWLEGKPLWKLIAEVSFEHEAGHIPDLERYTERWLQQAGDSISVNDGEVMKNGNRS